MSVSNYQLCVRILTLIKESPRTPQRVLVKFHVFSIKKNTESFGGLATQKMHAFDKASLRAF